MSDIVERLLASAVRSYENQPKWWRDDNTIERVLEHKAAATLKEIDT